MKNRRDPADELGPNSSQRSLIRLQSFNFPTSFNQKWVASNNDLVTKVLVLEEKQSFPIKRDER